MRMLVPVSSSGPSSFVSFHLTPSSYLDLDFKRLYRGFSRHLEVEVAQLQRLDGDVQHG